mmetsp:Transcript_69729/g.215603  ORF Transcript_69729/g.215603 Transcript_69729/m.215603 type:complete len:118 (-) Transcript_69729:942-1295(-)
MLRFGLLGWRRRDCLWQGHYRKTCRGWDTRMSGTGGTPGTAKPKELAEEGHARDLPASKLSPTPPPLLAPCQAFHAFPSQGSSFGTVRCRGNPNCNESDPEIIRGTLIGAASPARLS